MSLHVHQRSGNCLIKHIYDIDFYIWLRTILPKEDNKVFKTQIWKLFQLNDFKILMNNAFHHKGSVNGCLWLSAHKKCPLLNVNLKPSFLMQWLRDNASLTTQLVEEIVEPYTAQQAEHLLLSTTWNEAAKQAKEKCKPHASTTGTTVAPHPEQVPSLIQQVFENKSLDQNNDMNINNPVPDVARSSTHSDSVPDNIAVL